MFSARISAIGLSSDRESGDLGVIILVNGSKGKDYENHGTGKSSEYKDFDTALEIQAGSVINVVSITSNLNTQ